MNYNIRDVIDSVSEYHYLRIISDRENQPVHELIEHSAFCGECSRFLQYHMRTVLPTVNGSVVIEYRLKPLYPSCHQGINILVQWFVREYCITHTRIRKYRHSENSRVSFRKSSRKSA